MATVSATAGFLLGAVLVLSSVALSHSNISDARPAAAIADPSSNVDGVLLEGSLEEPRAVTAATTTTTTIVEISKMPRGRKMASEEGGNVVKKRDREEVMKVEGASKNVAGGGAGPFAARCADLQGEGELDVECKQSGRGLPSGDVNFVDFNIPFSSDYRGAKTHPPKNN